LTSNLDIYKSELIQTVEIQQLLLLLKGYYCILVQSDSFFSYTIAPAFFHRLMPGVLAGYTFVSLYLDDVIKSLDDHMNHLTAALVSWIDAKFKYV